MQQSSLQDLGNGYRKGSANAYNHYIIDEDGRVVVYSLVHDIHVFDKYILGERSPSKMPDTGSALASDSYGYFILDKTSGVLQSSVDESIYFETLKNLASGKIKVITGARYTLR